MYKLVVVAGKLRGKEFVLSEGENILGRDSGCDIHFPIQGVSKQHMSVAVTGKVAYIRDMDSANGTFLNGKAIKRGTVKNGDKIALPDSILQIVFVKEKKILIKKATGAEVDDGSSFYSGGTPPADLPGKIKHFFKYKLMKFLYGINEEYEWKVLFGILLTLFSVVTITLTIFPILEESKNLLMRETAKRGGHYAEEIARINANALENKKLDLVNTKFMQNEEGVKSYELFDLNGRIVRPMNKLNTFISDPFSVKALEWSKKTIDKEGRGVVTRRLQSGEIGIAKKIMAYDPKLGKFSPVGIIAIRFEPLSLKLEASKSTRSYLEALTTTALVAILFFGLVYYLTIRPIEEMNFQVDEALRGKRKNLESKFLMGEVEDLRETINSVLQRIREANNEEADEFAEIEGDEEYVANLKEFMLGSGVPTMILDSGKNVQAINVEAEDITGIRESSSAGEAIEDVTREKGFASTLIELCEESANSSGSNHNREYELSGINFSVNVCAVLGKDSFAKAYYITFIRE